AGCKQAKSNRLRGGGASGHHRPGARTLVRSKCRKLLRSRLFVGSPLDLGRCCGLKSALRKVHFIKGRATVPHHTQNRVKSCRFVSLVSYSIPHTIYKRAFLLKFRVFSSEIPRQAASSSNQPYDGRNE